MYFVSTLCPSLIQCVPPDAPYPFPQKHSSPGIQAFLLFHLLSSLSYTNAQHRYSVSQCESHRSAIVVLFLDVEDSSHAALCSSVWLQLLMKKAEEVGGSQSPLAPSHTYCIPVCCINTPTIFRNNNIT